jgi:acyl carrier protein
MNTQEALQWIAEVFEEPASRVAASTERKSIAGWDSLGTLSLIAALDEKFDIHLDEQEIEAMAQVEDILAVLRRNGALAEG